MEIVVLDASSIAAASQAVGGGYAECEAAIGFGGILCILSYVGILTITVLFQKNELLENINALKSASK